jgi:adenosylhomocysteine nucleosidase
MKTFLKLTGIIVFLIFSINLAGAYDKAPRVAVISAFKPELNLLLKKVKNSEKTVMNGKIFTRGKLQGKMWFCFFQVILPAGTVMPVIR